MGQLFLRPAQNDHEVLGDLLAPGGMPPFRGVRPGVVGGLIVNAQTIHVRPIYSTLAATARLPLIIDPATYFLQGLLREADTWTSLPFGKAARVSPADLTPPSKRRELVERVVDYQLEHGVSAVVPPYFYAQGPGDPWFRLTVDLAAMTQDYVEEIGVQQPLFPILCGQLRAFADDDAAALAVGFFSSTVERLNTMAVGLCVSPVSATDSYGKVLSLFRLALSLQRKGHQVVAWKSGFYGPALVAAGLDGYETGIGTAEMCNIPSSISARKPRDGKKNGGSPPGVFLDLLNRSIPAQAAEVVFSHLPLRARLLCSDERCCPHGVSSTLDNARHHAVRARARTLDSLNEIPHPAWRLHKASRAAEQSVLLSKQVDELLSKEGIGLSLKTRGLEALARVTAHLRDSWDSVA